MTLMKGSSGNMRLKKETLGVSVARFIACRISGLGKLLLFLLFIYSSMVGMATRANYNHISGTGIGG